MARLTGCLCLFLTLWMAGSRRPAIARIVKDDPWWGTKEAVEISRAAEQCRASGDYAALEQIEGQAYAKALQSGNRPVALRYLIAVGASQLLRAHLQSAVTTFLEARSLATRLDDRAALGSIAVNLSSAYLQVWDVDSAMQAAAAGMEAITGASQDPRAAYVRLPLLLQLGRLHQDLEDGRAAVYFEQAIEAARERGEIAQEARAWDQLGEERLQQNALGAAERDFAEGLRLRRLGAAGDLNYSYGRLGALAMARGEWEAAGRFTDQALEGRGPGLPRYVLLHQRGEIRLMHGDRRGALKDFRASMEQAGWWREQAPASPAARMAAEVELEKRIYRAFIETAAEEAVRSGDGRLAAEAFLAAESNRAVSLQATRPERRKVFAYPYENFLDQTSLIHFQQGLGTPELFLSLYLGDKGSYLWTVTRKKLSLHRLAAPEKIRREIGDFREAVRRGADIANAGGDGTGIESSRLGEKLYAALFGELSSEETEKPHWLLSLDDALFQLPFAALVVAHKSWDQKDGERRSGKMEYLVERHSVEVVAGALHMMDAAGRSAGGAYTRSTLWFLGVGDPIYNVADVRWKSASAGSWFKAARYTQPWFTGPMAAAQLNRLVGSGSEVEACARNWPGEATVLTGARADRGTFLMLAARQPAVIHLATHVVTQTVGPGKTDESLAFGIGASGAVETLSTADIASLQVPGVLVAMTGCESGGGEVGPVWACWG